MPTNLVNKNYKKAYDVNVNGTNNIINSHFEINITKLIERNK